MKTTHLPESIFKFRHTFSCLSTSMIKFVGGQFYELHGLYSNSKKPGHYGPGSAGTPPTK